MPICPLEGEITSSRLALRAVEPAKSLPAHALVNWLSAWHARCTGDPVVAERFSFAMPADALLIERLAQEIADYLALNTQAADDVDGIVRWWLRYDTRGKTREHVQAALDMLEAQGLVVHSVLKDGHVIYGRAQTP